MWTFDCYMSCWPHQMFCFIVYMNARNLKRALHTSCGSRGNTQKRLTINNKNKRSTIPSQRGLCNLSTCLEVHLCNRREINCIKTRMKSKEFGSKSWLQTLQYHPAVLGNWQNPWKMCQHSQSQNMWERDFLNMKQILLQPSATFSQDACFFRQRMRCHKAANDSLNTFGMVIHVDKITCLTVHV